VVGAQSKFRGNPQHLAHLVDSAQRGDISLWNRYVRKMGDSFRANLAGASLKNLALGEVNLVGADLCDSDLSRVNLVRANLTRARLKNASLAGANLDGARLDQCDFSNSDLSRANLKNTDLRTAIFADSTLDGSNETDSGKTANSSDLEPEEGSPKMRPWILALKEENQLRELRLAREKRQAAARLKNLNRKLGRRKPLFRRVK